jgi:hypothetical protein
VTRIYEILVIAGWIWAVLFAIFLIIMLYRRRQDARRGFEVTERHEK